MNYSILKNSPLKFQSPLPLDFSSLPQPPCHSFRDITTQSHIEPPIPSLNNISAKKNPLKNIALNGIQIIDSPSQIVNFESKFEKIFGFSLHHYLQFLSSFHKFKISKIEIENIKKTDEDMELLTLSIFFTNDFSQEAGHFIQFFKIENFSTEKPQVTRMAADIFISKNDFANSKGMGKTILNNNFVLLFSSPNVNHLDFEAVGTGAYAWKNLDLPLQKSSLRRVKSHFRKYNKRFHFEFSEAEIKSLKTPYDFSKLQISADHPAYNDFREQVVKMVLKNVDPEFFKWDEQTISFCALRPGLVSLLTQTREGTAKYSVYWDLPFKINHPSHIFFKPL